MKLLEYAWFKDIQTCIEELKELAMGEDWDYKKKPTGKNPILENYIKHTFIKVYEEKMENINCSRNFSNNLRSLYVGNSCCC